MARRVIKDDDGNEVVPGCVVCFSYGIPPVAVRAKVIERGGRLIALTPGHNPPECGMASLRKHVGTFWIEKTE